MLYIGIPISPSKCVDDDLQAEQMVCNLIRAMNISNYMIEKNKPHINPAISILLNASKPRPYHKWLEYDNIVLDKCEGMLIAGYSNGVLKEIEYCRKHNKPVYLTFSFGESPKYIFDEYGVPKIVKDGDEAMEYYIKMLINYNIKSEVEKYIDNMKKRFPNEWEMIEGLVDYVVS